MNRNTFGNRAARLRAACGLALMCSAPALAQSGERAVAPLPPARVEVPQEQAGMLPQARLAIEPDEKHVAHDLRAMAEDSARIVDAEVIRAEVFTPPGLRVLMTRYTFRVHEWLKGAERPREFSVESIGGEDANGDGMYTADSYRLKVGGRYLVFLRPDAAEVVAPFNAVIQILSGGAEMANKGGRVLVSAEGGMLVARTTSQAPSMQYMGVAPPAQQVAGGKEGAPRPMGLGCSSAIEPEIDLDALPPIPAEDVLKQLRAPGAQPPAGPGPAGQPGVTLGGTPDYIWCGWISGSINYRSWVPDNNNWNWTTDAMVDWNYLVAGGGASTWMYGYFTDAGGNPIRNQLPTANNNVNNYGVVTSAQRTAGGYPTWEASGSPNGECFVWYTGGSCTRIRETDTFVNPVNGGNELQFRKTAVHEMGHGFGLQHEDKYVAIMVSGTWRVPPNYASNLYARMDDYLGARQVLQFANSQSANSFVYNNFRDIATSSQSHPNWGTSGDIGPNVATLNTYSANVGDTLTLSRLFVENRGPLAYAGTVTMSVYLSSNNIISSGDYLMGTWTWNGFGGFSAANNFSVSFPIPAAVPTGNYYIGWIMTSPEGQLRSDNDTAIVVTDSSSGFAQRTISVTNATPANDECANAIPIGDGIQYSSTQFATLNGSASCGGGGTGPDIWYRYTAACSGALSLTTCGSNFDTVLSVHTGCPGTSANVVPNGCNDDDAACGGSPPRQSAVTINATAGTTYYIRVAGYNGAKGFVQLNSNLTPIRPANDDCANAFAIGEGTFTGNTTCASTDGSADCGTSNASPDVWFSYTPRCSGLAEISTCGSSYDTVLAVYDTCGGTQLACDDDGCGYPYSKILLPVTAGTPYLVRVSGYNGARGNFSLTTNVTSLPPVNDNCADAVALVDGSYLFETCGATTDGPPEPLCSFCCNDPQVHKDVWNTYTALDTGGVTIDMCQSNFDTKIVVYANGCPASGGSLIACNDDFCGTRSQVNFAATRGTTYWIRYGGYSGQSGSGVITISGPAAPAVCYANCDQSTVPPVLNAGDFGCFLNQFRSASALPYAQQVTSYANCDESTTAPVLNAGDFACFLQKFRAGCP